MKSKVMNKLPKKEEIVKLNPTIAKVAKPNVKIVTQKSL